MAEQMRLQIISRVRDREGVEVPVDLSKVVNELMMGFRLMCRRAVEVFPDPSGKSVDINVGGGVSGEIIRDIVQKLCAFYSYQYDTDEEVVRIVGEVGTEPEVEVTPAVSSGDNGDVFWDGLSAKREAAAARLAAERSAAEPDIEKQPGWTKRLLKFLRLLKF